MEKLTMKYDELTSRSLTELCNPLPYIITNVYDSTEQDEEGNDIRVKYAEYIDLGVCPASYSCALKELLSSDSGRTEDTTYNKMRLGKYIEIAISYRSMNSDDLAILLNNFSDEYVTVCYFDPRKNSYRIDEFYLGETSVPLYNGKMGFWDSFSLTLAQRKADEDEILTEEEIPEAAENPNEEVIIQPGEEV